MKNNNLSNFSNQDKLIFQQSQDNLFFISVNDDGTITPIFKNP